jgi:hypothetical protein
MPVGLVQNVSSVVGKLRERLPFGKGGGAGKTSIGSSGSGVFGGAVGGAESRRAVRAARQYMAERQAGRLEGVLGLVSDGVELRSSRDGWVRGRKEFEAYVRRVRPVGRWGEPEWNAARRRAEVRGVLKVVMVSVAVTAHFRVDRFGKIDQIYVGTAGKAD